MSLDAGIVSASFDASLEMVRELSRQCFVLCVHHVHSFIISRCFRVL